MSKLRVLFAFAVVVAGLSSTDRVEGGDPKPILASEEPFSMYNLFVAEEDKGELWDYLLIHAVAPGTNQLPTIEITSVDFDESFEIYSDDGASGLIWGYGGTGPVYAVMMEMKHPQTGKKLKGKFFIHEFHSDFFESMLAPGTVNDPVHRHQTFSGNNMSPNDNSGLSIRPACNPGFAPYNAGSIILYH